MVRPQIIQEKPISMIDLKKELADIKERDKELGFRSNKTEEYINHFINIDTKKAEELKKKLDSLDITRLKEEITIKIMDLMPETVDDLKTILQGYTTNIAQKDIESIVAVVKEFIPKDK